MAISFSLGAFGVAVAVSTPLMAIFNPRIGRNRKSRTGPWQAGWMDPRDIAHMARNKTGLPLALHKGKLLRYQKADESSGEVVTISWFPAHGAARASAL